MATRAVTQLYDDALRPSGLRVTQFSVLAALARMGEASVGELAEALAIDQSTLTRGVALLERRELTERAPHPDARVKSLRLTAQGRAALELSATSLGEGPEDRAPRARAHGLERRAAAGSAGCSTSPSSGVPRRVGARQLPDLRFAGRGAVVEGGTRRSRGARERPSGERCQDLLRGSDHQLDDRADQRHPAGSDERATQTSGSELPPRRI